MSQFGDHALLFNFSDFVNALVKNLEAAGCGYGYHPIKYIDKRNHGLIREYYDKIDEDSKSMAHLFVKDTANSYPLQNEWRFVFFDYNNYFPCCTCWILSNCGFHPTADFIQLWISSNCGFQDTSIISSTVTKT